MPYKIFPKGSGYVVKNIETGKEHSKRGISKAKAEAQMRLLMMIETRNKK